MINIRFAVVTFSKLSNTYHPFIIYTNELYTALVNYCSLTLAFLLLLFFLGIALGSFIFLLLDKNFNEGVPQSVLLATIISKNFGPF
jgi:hypothetical protein